jgi:hypothetical protein
MLKKTVFKVWLQISGIGACSGLVFYENSYYLIADHSKVLYQYEIPSKKLHKISLEDTLHENLSKKKKLDLESITLVNGTLYLFASGSKKNRHDCYLVDVKTQKVEKKSLKNFYQLLQQKANLPANEINIEGSVFYQNKWYFLQRGNGELEKNGIFVVNHPDFLKADDIIFKPIKLPKINNVSVTFTDATLVEPYIYFTAAAEGTNNTYNDGEILDSMVGKISLPDLKVEKLYKLPRKIKTEGITLLKQEQEQLTFILSEDNDSDDKHSTLYSLTMKP